LGKKFGSSRNPVMNPLNNPLCSIHRPWHHHWRPILITLALITLLIWSLALTQPRKLVEGVWTLNLDTHCHLHYHANIPALALACPGVDYIRLWPLPLERPWQATPDPPAAPLLDPFPASYAAA